MGSQQPNSSQRPNNGNSASSISPSSGTAQSPAMLSRFLYDRSNVPDRLVARSFDAAPPTRPNGHDASASELEQYMSQSTSNAAAGRTGGR